MTQQVAHSTRDGHQRQAQKTQENADKTEMRRSSKYYNQERGQGKGAGVGERIKANAGGAKLLARTGRELEDGRQLRGAFREAANMIHLTQEGGMSSNEH